MAALVVLMLTLTADAVMRYLFNSPILGAADIVRFSFVSTVFFGMAYTALKKGHVSIDILSRKLKGAPLAALNSIVDLPMLILIGLVVWQTVLRAMRSWAAGEVTAALRFPLFPFMFVVALGSLVWFFVVLADLLSSTAKVVESKHTGARLALIVASPLTLLLLGAIAGHWLPMEVSPMAAGVTAFLLLVPVFLTSLQVGFTMMLLGFLGLSFMLGFGIGVTPLGQVPFTEASSYGMAVVPLFILMGELIYYSKIGQELYYAAYTWIGRLRGGLASATVAACAAFAAVSGSTVATAVTIGTVSLPEMKRYKYNHAFAAAATAAGGIIGTMIPPSLAFIIYGIIAEESIGRLFIAGIVPGLMITLAFIATITIMCLRNPNLGPAAPAVTMKERFGALQGIWPILILFVLVIGGLYMGLFTATEAGGIGASGALIIGLAMRRFSKQSFVGALRATIVTTGMVLLLMIGASVFSSFIAISRLPAVLANFIATSGFPSVAVILIIIGVFFVLGMVMTSYAILIIITPIVLPTVLALGYDPIWLGVLLVLQTEIGALTPPVAINIFAVAGLDREIPMGSIYRAIWPFVGALLVVTAILIAFPQIALFLPKLMKG
jgi:tripartite ATP-independent transporter DctM subunit